MVSLKNHFLEISVVILLVSGSYFLASVFFNGTNFYVFDAIWRICIVGVVIGIFQFHPRLSLRQYFVLGVVFCFEYFLYRLFSPSISLLNMSITSILAPIAEEVLFRGWVMSKIEGSKRDKIIYSSVFFSLYHLKNAFVLTPVALAYQMTYALLVVGPLFAWVRLRFDTIFASLLLHSINNALADLMTTKIFPTLMKRSKDF